MGGVLWALFFGGMAILSGIIAALLSYATYNLMGNFYALIRERKGYLSFISLYLLCLFF